MIKNEKAFAMIFTLALLAVVPVMALTLANYSLNSFQIARGTNNNTKAYYIARSGAEAAISAWKEADVENGSLETVIFDNQDNFVLKSEYQDNFSQYGEMIAEIDVEFKKEPLNPDQEQYGYTMFTSTAKMINSAGEETVKARVSPYLNVNSKSSAEELGWYNYDTGQILPGSNVEETAVTEDFWDWLSGIFGIGYEAETVEIKYHGQIFGAVEINTDGSDLYLQNNNSSNKVAYSANSIYFNNELDLKQSGNNQGALITIGENLVFRERVEIRKGFTSYGSLIIGLPGGLGYQLDGYSGDFGRVYFNQGVYSSGWFWDNEIIAPGSAYYFKKITETNESGEIVQTGIDLLRWDDGDYDEQVLVPIPADDPNYSPPVPEEEYIINWF